MPVHRLVKVTPVELSSSNISTNQTMERPSLADGSIKRQLTCHVCTKSGFESMQHLVEHLSVGHSDVKLLMPHLPDFRSEADRLASFSQWSVSFMKPADLAKAGFYSLKNSDMCRCAFCHSRVEDWVEGDQPMEEHEKLCPDCPFVLGKEVGNVPITWLSSIRKMKEEHVKDSQSKENRVMADQVKENQGKGPGGKEDQELKHLGKKYLKGSVKRVKRSRTVGGRFDLQKLMLKVEDGRHIEKRKSEDKSEAFQKGDQGVEIRDIKLNTDNQNNNEEHWEELQKLSQRELLDDPDFEPFKQKRPRKSAPPITPIAPSPARLEKSSPSGTVSVPKEAKKADRRAGEVDIVKDTRCTRIPELLCALQCHLGFPWDLRTRFCGTSWWPFSGANSLQETNYSVQEVLFFFIFLQIQEEEAASPPSVD